MQSTPRALLFIFLILLGTAFSAASAAPQVSALSDNGDLYKAYVDRIGTLFPDAAEPLRSNIGIAIEIKRNGEAPQRLLVPTTEGSEAESMPFLLVEGRTNGVHLIWESRRNFIHSQIHLVTFADGQWSDVIELSGEFFSQKSAPRISVTRDSYQEVDPASGVLVTYHLTNFHTVWFEDSSNGRQAVYSLVQFKNGLYQNPNHVFVLNELDVTEGHGLAAPRAALLEAPNVTAGRDDQHAVAVFADQSSGHLTTIDFALVPQSIVRLAEKIRAEIIDIGHSGRNKQALVDAIQLQLLANGQDIHPDFLNYMSQIISESVMNAAPDVPTSSLSEKIRAEIIDIGARLTLRDKNDFTDTAVTTAIEIPAIEEEDSVPSILLTRVASSRPAPAVGDGTVTVYPSPDGSNVIVAWEGEGALYYVESQGEDWSGERKLDLDADLTLAAAHQLLEHRSRNR